MNRLVKFQAIFLLVMVAIPIVLFGDEDRPHWNNIEVIRENTEPPRA